MRRKDDRPVAPLYILRESRMEGERLPSHIYSPISQLAVESVFQAIRVGFKRAEKSIM